MSKYILIILLCSLLTATQEKRMNTIDIKVNNVVLKSIGNTDLGTPKTKFNGIVRLNLNKMCQEQPNHMWCMKN